MLLALLAAIRMLGFSPDDRQAAWIESGEREGSGAPYAVLHVMDVGLGVDTVATFDSEDKAVGAAKGAWVQPRVIAHEGGELSDRTGAPIGTLRLIEKKAKGGKCDEPFDALLLRLVMHFMDDDKPAAVGAEKAPPKSRPCASACSIDKVYAHGKAALVLVKCAVPGFEGKGESFTAFAKGLPYGLDEDLPPQ